jgi:hypothetical protein
MRWLSKFQAKRQAPTFRQWLRSRRRLSDWVERALPADVTSASEIMKVAGHEHASDYRAWVGADLKAAIFEWRRNVDVG